jgi:hypothetical protein
MTAYVHGPESAHYDFTSALPVQLLVTLAPSLMPLIEKQDTVMIPGAHVTPAAPPAPVSTQLTDDVATVKPAPDDAQPEEVAAPVKAAAKAEAGETPHHKPAADAAPAKASGTTSAKAADKAAEPAHAKPAADAKRVKPAAAEEHPKAADALRAKPAAPRAKPRADEADVPKTEAARPKPPAVEEVLH